MITEGITFENREQRVREVARARGLALVHPFDDWDVIHGQATAALELLEDHPRLHLVAMPIGGGGLASGTALAREALRIAQARHDSALARALSDGRELAGPLVTELAHDGDAAALEAIELIGSRLGVGIASLVNVFNPQVVVVGGGVIGAGELLLAPARAEVARRALPPSRDVVRIVPAPDGFKGGSGG